MHDPIDETTLEQDSISQTNRKTVKSLEAALNKTFPVLDKGFVRVIDYMGNDEAIVQAARVSYGKGTKSLNHDEGLIRYLMRHRHTTPFEMCEIKLHIKAPIFVARQWLRHRTANVNEISARYSVLNEEYYVPNIEEICKQSKSNKQGRADIIESSTASTIKSGIENTCADIFNKYHDFIQNHNLTRELARIILPVSAYTEFYWKIDLHNLMHFLFLRAGHGAQKEIRDYAFAILELVKEWVPLTYKAFMDYRMNCIEFSGNELEKLASCLNKDKVMQLVSEEGVKGEAKEFLDKLSKLVQK